MSCCIIFSFSCKVLFISLMLLSFSSNVFALNFSSMFLYSSSTSFSSAVFFHISTTFCRSLSLRPSMIDSRSFRRLITSFFTFPVLIASSISPWVRLSERRKFARLFVASFCEMAYPYFWILLLLLDTAPDFIFAFDSLGAEFLLIVSEDAIIADIVSDCESITWSDLCDGGIVWFCEWLEDIVTKRWSCFPRLF